MSDLRSMEDDRPSDGSESSSRNPQQEEFRAFMEEITSEEADEPIIPTELANAVSQSAGCDLRDQGLRRLLSIATQKFLQDLAQSAMDAHTAKPPSKEERKTLRVKDVATALEETGYKVHQPPYYANETTEDVGEEEVADGKE